jgi:ATP-dependent Clp protease adapter protein ClpS
MNTRKRRKRVTLYLNDDFNSFDTVSLALMTYVPRCNAIRAEQLALLAHNSGKTQICSGFSPAIYQVQANLIRSGLIIETK